MALDRPQELRDLMVRFAAAGDTIQHGAQRGRYEDLENAVLNAVTAIHRLSVDRNNCASAQRHKKAKSRLSEMRMSI